MMPHGRSQINPLIFGSSFRILSKLFFHFEPFFLHLEMQRLTVQKFRHFILYLPRKSVYTKSLNLSSGSVHLKFRDLCASFCLICDLQPFSGYEFALALPEFTVFFSLQPVWVSWR